MSYIYLPSRGTARTQHAVRVKRYPSLQLWLYHIPCTFDITNNRMGTDLFAARPRIFNACTRA